MGRKKIEVGVRELYEFDSETQKSSCLICDYKTNGSHLGNLKKHLIRSHEEVFKEIETAIPEEEEPVRKKIKVTVEYDPVELLDAWINLVIKEGRPFCILDSKSLHTIIKPLFAALDITMVNSSNISAEIKSRAEQMRLHITKMLASKIVSIKIDSGTRHSRRVLCINVQTVIKGKIIIQTLSMSEIHRAHSGVNLKEHVLSVLEKYNISLERVYSITTDNGSNMLCAGELMCYEDSDETGSDDDIDDNSSAYEVNDEAFNLELESIRLDGVHIERCAAHTAALAVDDSLKEATIKRPIEKCRKLAIHLRTPTRVEQIKSMKMKRAKRDNDTRWNSKYDMVLSLVELKQFCISKNITILIESDWTFCDIFLEVFKPVKVATKLLQAKDLALGDFFKIWLDMTLRVQQLTKSSKHTVVATFLHEKLMEREAMLFEDNDTLLAALYLDPRFRRVLKKLKPQYFDEDRARNHLISLFKSIKKVEQQNREQRQKEKQKKQQVQAGASGSSDVAGPSDATDLAPSESKSSGATSRAAQPDSETSTKDDNILENFMEELFDDYSNDEDRDLEDDVLAAIRAIRNYNDKKPLSTNVIQYWYSKRFSDATLSKLALILHAVPATEVSCERCFSTLRFILSDYRTNIRPDTLADLMLLKLNSEI